MKELILRTLTGVLLIILVAGSILVGPVPFLGMILLVYVLGIRELFTIFQLWKTYPRLVMAVSAGLLMPLSYAMLQFQMNSLWFILPAAGWIIGFIWSGLIARSTLILIWISVPLTSFFLLGWIEKLNAFDSLLPLSVIALVWINDTFAYVVGSLVGKHKMTPSLSPGKTWEGFGGGILFTLTGGWIIFRISGEFTLVIWILFALIISSLGLLGDLYESSLKRKMKVKNMGKLLPGHGGILDRFDSLLFVAPAILILVILIRIIQ